MAQFLRLIHICEARGSGFDRMEEGMRDLKIPATKVESGEDFCRILLYWHKSFADWSKGYLAKLFFEVFSSKR